MRGGRTPLALGMGSRGPPPNFLRMHFRGGGGGGHSVYLLALRLDYMEFAMGAASE